MDKAVVVTGTPGTGKTTAAMQLAKKAGWKYVDVNKLISKHNLSEGYDQKKKCRVVDVKKLNSVLGDIIKKSETQVVIDSHLAHHLPKELVRKCVVTKCNLKLLKKRMKKRGYPEHKIKENLECEIFDICLNEARENGHDVIIVETDKRVDHEKLIKEIKRKTKKKQK